MIRSLASWKRRRSIGSGQWYGLLRLVNGRTESWSADLRHDILDNLATSGSSKSHIQLSLSSEISTLRHLTFEQKRVFHGGLSLLSPAQQVPVPPLGESISDGVIATVLKEQGDEVEEDEPLLQIETDKVTIDVRSPVAGVVDAILVSFDRAFQASAIRCVIFAGF